MIHTYLCRLAELSPACNVLLKITIVLAVTWLLHAIVRQRSAHWRLLLWRSVGMAIVAIPVLAGMSPTIPIAVPSPVANLPVDRSEAFLSPAMLNDLPVAPPIGKPLSTRKHVSVATSNPTPAMAETFPIWIRDHAYMVLLTVWIAGMAVLLARWLIAWLRVRRMVAAATPATEKQQRYLRRIARELKWGAVPELRVAEGVSGPFLTGIRRPVVLLPQRMTSSIEPGELSAILLHELAHLHNRDLRWMAFLRGVAIALWWHPLAWRICRAHGQACEEACDASAAACLGDVAAYSRTLAQLALSALKSSSPMAGVSMARSAGIVRRLSRVACRVDVARPGFRRVGVAGLLVAAALIALGGLQLVVASSADTVVAGDSGGAARVLHFPADRSLGTVLVQNASLQHEFRNGFFYWIDNGISGKWRVLAEARGNVAIPAGQRVSLAISREGWRDLSALNELAYDDIYQLSFAGLGNSLQPEMYRQQGFFDLKDAGDEVMPHVAHLTGLRILLLRQTDVTGEGLRYLDQLKSLEELYVPPRTDDIGLTHVAKLTGLKRLYFGENSVTNKGLAKLAALRNLEELDLFGKQIGDAGLVHLAKLPNLRHLWLTGRQFTDAGIAHVSRIRSLRTFSPQSTSIISDKGLEYLSTLPNLERLSLHHNERITDRGMIHVVRMPALRQLDVGGTHISDAGLAHLQRLKNLEWLELPYDATQAGLTSLLAKQTILRHLGCPGSTLATYGDGLLRLIGNMPHLEELFVGSSDFTDDGVAELVRCNKLRRLIIMHSPITNKAVGHIGRLKELELLQITGSKATTSGIAQINGLTNLTSLMVSPVRPDKGFIDISGLKKLKQLWLTPPPNKDDPKRGFRDGDLACLARLERLDDVQIIGPGEITDSGLAYLAGLTRLRRLCMEGPGVTDVGLAHLSKMQHLDLLRIGGNITEEGLSSLARHPTLGSLSITSTSTQPLSPEALMKLRAQLPRLIRLEYAYHHP
jgi:beta-lactamase regulating signal transducer with metallopeptidase domain/Leucine-rich repeat (LRR) protein